MDPHANMARQRVIIAEMQTLAVEADPPDRDPKSAEALAQLGLELATLVEALDEWRMNGGFDPYLQGFEPTGDIEERMTFMQGIRIRKLFNDFRARRAVLDDDAPGIPAGYLGLLIQPESGNTIEFGIDREGTASS